MIIQIIRILLSFLVLNNVYAAAFQTTIPLEFNTGNPAPYGLPSTVITIQGKTFPMIVDTGAKHSAITLTKYALQNIHVKFTGEQKCFKALDGRHCQNIFVIPEVRIGDFVVKNVKGSLMTKLWGGGDSGFKETEASRNGVIGYQLLSKFNLLLDYPHSKAILTKLNNPIGYDVNQWIAVPFNGHLQSHLIVNNKPVIFVWDTGAVPSGIKKSIVTSFPKIQCSDEAPYNKNNCVRIETYSFKTDAGNILPKTWFELSDIPSWAPFDGLIGSNFYKEHLVYFNFDKKFIYIK